jgi:exopolyphosphatase/guanosine-5'-triphosphate,3'-diphosphate pyrophosphatase
MAAGRGRGRRSSGDTGDASATGPSVAGRGGRRRRTGAASESVAAPWHGRVGVVDIGSNTVRLVVYETPIRLPVPIFNEKADCRLAEGLSNSGRLSPRGVERAVATLKRFVRLADAMGVDTLELVATAAVRDAADGPAFVRAAEAACGKAIHVLSGAEEARLAAVGVLNGTPGADGVLADLGGGSLDLVALDVGRVAAFATLPCGHLRLAEDAGFNRAAAWQLLEERLATVPWLDRINGRTLYCVGGTWRALAKIFIDQTNHPLHVVDNFTLGFFQARRAADLIANLSRETLAQWPGIDANRLEGLPYAAAALMALLDAGKPREIVFSAFGMREGQMLELLPAAVRHQDPLISACESRSERSGRFALHGQEILDWMTPLFGDEREGDRRLRLAICLLSDIGWNEHPDYRALHAFQRVLRLPFPGLSHSDRAESALAVLIRYGGEEEGEMVAPVRVLLDGERQLRARTIGLALRLAHSMSGGAPGLLPQTRLKAQERDLVLELPEDPGVFLSEAVERRFGRLAKTMGLRARITTG